MRTPLFLFALLGLSGCYLAHGPEDAGVATAAPDGGALDGGASEIDDPVVQIAAGAEHACARRASGRVVCWGRNDHGQLGAGAADTRGPINVGGLPEATDITAGGNQTCAVTLAGAVYCWGRLRRGPDTYAGIDRRRPTQLAGTEDVVRVRAGQRAVCAEHLDGRVRCWGLGPPNTEVLREPAEILLGATSVSPGIENWCGLDARGDVYCWGRNTSGQVGDGTDVQRLVPARVEGVSDATLVDTEGVMSCSLSAEGASCWGLFGDPGAGCLARPHTRATVIPLERELLGMSVGGAHACAVEVGGRVFCWGSGAEGQLGSPLPACRLLFPTSDRPLEVPVAPASGVASGAAFSCARHHAGRVSCWGNNRAGQLGSEGGPAPREVRLP